MRRYVGLFVVLAVACGCTRADERARPPSPSSEITAAVTATPVTPAPRGEAPPVADDEGGASTALGQARRLARDEDHRGAIAALDRVLASSPDDPRALAMRGHQYLYVSGAPARVRARADLERASTLTASDARLGSTIAFNLGLLADREGDGARAREHYTTANRLHPSATARAHAAGTRECRVVIREESSPRDIVTSYREAATLARHALDAEVPEAPESEDDARGALCGEYTPCRGAPPMVGIGGGFDGAWANVIVPVGPDRMRIVPGLLRASSEYHCTPDMDAEVVSRGAWVASLISLTRSEAVEEDLEGRACDPHEDGECMRGCFWSRREVANVFVRSRDGLARVVIWSAPTPEDRAGEGRVAAYHEVDVERVGAGVRVRGCGVARVVALPE